jgi:predicted O-methyltransferase YrrM
MTPAYRFQGLADAYVAEHMDSDLVDRICAIPAFSSPREGRLLFYLASISPKNAAIVEIGAFKGRSTAWLAEVARRSERRLISIDPHLRDSVEEFNRTVERFDIASVATIHRAFSHEIGKDWKEPISFLWIDGGHDYETVRQDIADFTPHLVPGGYIVFDDAGPEKFPGVVRAIDETLRRDARFEGVGLIKNFDIFRQIGDPDGTGARTKM